MEINTRIPIDKIIRVSNIRDEKLDIMGLRGSIEIHGLLQPIIVEESTKGYKIIAGHRRYLACKALGHETIPAVVQKFKNPQIIQITENIQRENLNKIDESKAIFEMKKKLCCKLADLSRHLGKDPMWIKKRIAFHEVRTYLIASEIIPAKSINTLTFDIALKMYEHGKTHWLKMAGESLGKRWYPEELEEKFNNIADPDRVIIPPKKNISRAPSFKSKLGREDFGEFNIERNNHERTIKIVFTEGSAYFKMLELLHGIGGEVL